jgi:hypothetical protein
MPEGVGRGFGAALVVRVGDGVGEALREALVIALDEAITDVATGGDGVRSHAVPTRAQASVSRAVRVSATGP